MQKNHAKRTVLALFLLFAVTVSAQAAKIAEVIPIGHTVGIKMQAEGVLIVQLTEVQGADGTRSPAKEAGVQEGDVLFIDEIHRLSRQVEEVLYPALVRPRCTRTTICRSRSRSRRDSRSS